MFVQRLKEYAERHLQEALADPCFEPGEVLWFIKIDREGGFLAIEPTVGKEVQRGRKTFHRSKRFDDLPKAGNRSSASESLPTIGVDGLAYCFGPGKWTKKDGDKEKESRHHEAFKSLLTKAAEATGDAALRACVNFYSRPDEVAEAKAKMEAESLGPGGRAALAVDGDGGRPVFEREKAKAFWREHFGNRRGPSDEGGNGGSPHAICLVCGKEGPIAPTNDKIKGLGGNLGGQPTGTSLMSFDKKAFVSRGWEQNENSPTCRSCAEAYVRALNHLLETDKAKRTRVDLGGAAFIFWARESDFPAASLLDEADPKEVEKLLLAVHGGTVGGAVDGEEFYAAALSGNGGRAVVRSWIESTVGEAKRNIGRWFEDLAVVAERDQLDEGKAVIVRAGHRARPPRLFELCLATAVDSDAVSPETGPALMSSALNGSRIPFSILASCLRRARAGKDRRSPPRFTPERMGLIRAALNRSREGGEVMMSECLDGNCSDSGYVCGRLLAALAYVQAYSQSPRSHNFGAGAQIVERYFGAASVAPQSVFPVLLRLNRHHLKKAADASPGFGVNRERDLEDMLCLLRKGAGPDFPAILDLKAQGRFMLGFYQQRAQYRKDAATRKEDAMHKPQPECTEVK